jgi:adenylate cyclase
MGAFLCYDSNSDAQRVPCKEVTSIGRDVSNDIVLDDPLVSRRHAMICRLQGDIYYLIDEGSSNGVHLNARRITLPTMLRNGDQITIGSLSIRFDQAPTEMPSVRAGQTSHVPTVIVPPSVEVVRTAILVADIRGFTQMSETMPVRRLTELMNEWFRAATGCIKERYGLVDKFLGDCVYARWDADRDRARAVMRAIDAACQLNRISEQLKTAHPELPASFGIGAGVNFGVAAIGTEQGRTGIGDAVNLTFRLQEQTKRLGKNIVVAQDAYELLPERTWLGRERSITVAGKTQPVNVCGLSFEEAELLLRMGDETQRV